MPNLILSHTEMKIVGKCLLVLVNTFDVHDETRTNIVTVLEKVGRSYGKVTDLVLTAEDYVTIASCMTTVLHRKSELAGLGDEETMLIKTVRDKLNGCRKTL